MIRDYTPNSYFRGFILINFPMQLIWRPGSETVFGPKLKTSLLTRLST